MCGRIEVNKPKIDSVVYKALKIRFEALHNPDLRPSQQVACLGLEHAQVNQINAHWGIKPEWATHPIINAQAETVAVKKTFSAAYALHRCVVPCTGWFEWTGERGQKTKYRFTDGHGEVLFMAGILFPDAHRAYSLVTLTKPADTQCMAYHHRMPLFIALPDLTAWLSLPQADLSPYLQAASSGFLIKQTR